jgi:hypothetical protein
MIDAALQLSPEFLASCKFPNATPTWCPPRRAVLPTAGRLMIFTLTEPAQKM